MPELLAGEALPSERVPAHVPELGAPGAAAARAAPQDVAHVVSAHLTAQLTQGAQVKKTLQACRKCISGCKSNRWRRHGSLWPMMSCSELPRGNLQFLCAIATNDIVESSLGN